MSVPAITLTATVQDITGSPVGSVSDPCKLFVALCGFGSAIPRIAGTSMIARSVMYLESTTGSFSTALWGNDAITPAGQTFYSIALLDGQGRVVQCGAYQLTGSGTQDLSNLTPISFPGTTPPIFNFAIAGVPTVQNATGTVNGVNAIFTFSAPATPTPIVAVYAGGIFQSPNAPASDYSISYSGSNTWTITFGGSSIPGVAPVTVLLFQQPSGNGRTITSPQTIITSGAIADNTIFCNFSVAGTITIPSAATAGNDYELTFIDVSYNAVAHNIILSGSINNGASYTINTNGGAVTIRSDGSGWRIKSTH